MSPYAELPRELIDNIITQLISLYDNDPAYQWTCLRFITRYHKTLIEQHFYDFWVPKLSFTTLLDNSFEYDRVCFEPCEETAPDSESKDENGLPILVAFEADRDADDLTTSLDVDSREWVRRVISPEWSPPYEGENDKEIVVGLGEGTLNKGFTKGGIVSDVVIPGAYISTEPDPWQLSFEWRKLFSWLFREEMLLRRFRDKVLEDFLPTIDESKSAEERTKIIYKFLCNHYEGQSKLIIEAFRRHLAWESRARHDAESEAQPSLDPHTDSFDMTSFLNQPPIDITELEDRIIDHIIYSIGGGQSIVFRIPGWETCSMRQLARLRILDEYIENEEMLPGQGRVYAGRAYYNDLHEREEMMKKGKKEASEETLERYLRGPSLDRNMFWE